MRWWDRSWNPVTGCRSCSPACSNCVSLINLEKQGRSREPQFNSTAFEKELHGGQRYVTCSLGDVFDHENWNEIDMVFRKMIDRGDSTFFVCTKKPDQLVEWLSGASFEESLLDHIWMGTSIETGEYVWRVDELIRAEGIKNRYVHVEPMLGPISLRDQLSTGKIHWITVGCETGDHRRSAEIEWMEELLAESREFGVPAFVNFVEVDGVVTDDLSKFPESLRVRETPWGKFAGSLEKREILGNKVSLIRDPGGGMEILCPLPIFWKLDSMVKGLKIMGFEHKGKTLPESKALEDAVRSSIDSFQSLRREEELPNQVAWSFLPEAVSCRMILDGRALKKLSDAGDREIQEIVRTSNKMME